MYDLLPFPRLPDGTPEEQIKELYSYLIQFKETLEFALTNINQENLSPEFLAKIEKLIAYIDSDKAERENEYAQLAKKNGTN